MESTDKTKRKVDEMKVPIVTIPFSHYVEPARALGISKAQGDWVFILDADERITKSLAREIKDVSQNNPSDAGFHSYYKVPRKNIFGRKKWLSHGGWWPDYQTRLIYKPHFQSWPKEIHSRPKIKGIEGFLKEPLTHYFHGDLEKMVEKTTIFENIESDLLYKAGRPVQVSTFFRKFFGELFRRLIKNKGFLDGPIGIIESVYQAYSKTITYLYLYEKKKGDSV
jgi:glycosyltransferase involved in cell wall biosynthesis